MDEMTNFCVYFLNSVTFSNFNRCSILVSFTLLLFMYTNTIYLVIDILVTLTSSVYSVNHLNFQSVLFKI